MQDDAVNIPLGGHFAIGLLLFAVLNQRQHHVIAGSGVAFAGTRDKVAENRVHHLVLGRQRDHVTDGHRAPCGQCFGAGVGAVVVLLCGGCNALAGCLAHLGKAVERAAHCRLRQVQICGQFLQVH